MCFVVGDKGWLFVKGDDKPLLKYYLQKQICLIVVEYKLIAKIGSCLRMYSENWFPSLRAFFLFRRGNGCVQEMNEVITFDVRFDRFCVDVMKYFRFFSVANWKKCNHNFSQHLSQSLWRFLWKKTQCFKKKVFQLAFIYLNKNFL